MSNEAQNWIVQFGCGELYFNWRSWNAGYENANSFVSAVTPIYSMDGAVENFGSRPNPKKPVTLTVTAIFSASSSSEMQELLDQFDKVHDGSTRPLFYAPAGTYDTNLWRRTMAKPTEISDSRPVTSGITVQRRVVYSLSDPYWYRPRFNNQWYLDGCVDFDAAGNEKFGSTTVYTTWAQAATETVNNRGTARALPLISFIRSTGTITAITFRRLLNSTTGQIGDEFSWTGSMGAGESLIVDCQRQVVSDLAGFSVAEGQQHFMQFVPGENILEMTTLTGGNVDVHMFWDYTYHA